MNRIDLSGDWTLVRAGGPDRVPARVPGDTHSALLRAGKIPDPYVAANELDVQWVGREDWIYERTVQVPADFLEGALVYLDCDSLDTIAEVRVNNQAVGTSDNMFAGLRLDVRDALRSGPNTIAIHFTSAENTAARRAQELPYEVPHTQYPVQSQHRNLVRKVQCHAGWDWGPCLMVAGIYGAIALVSVPLARIERVATSQKHAKGSVAVTVEVTTLAARAGEAELAVTLGQQSVHHRLPLVAGESTVSLELTVRSPRLWWPNGYGEQPLYDLTVDLDGQVVKKRLGLRNLEHVSKEDADGLSMYFRVNGVDIFAKGANWIPNDALPERQTREHYDRLLSAAAAANMNMLRVWGGGQYEGDAFYELCDEKGILIWQDLMFSCSLYPSTPDFLASVEREVKWQASRLRDHACLALWCGNNENVGALKWFPVSRANRDRYIVDYDRLTEGTVGRTLDVSDPTHAYWPSSPCGGRGDYTDNWHGDSRGDMHYWNVWHEGSSFDAFYTVKPRFCSEFGYQSFPSLSTIRGYAPEEDWNVTSPLMEHHQRNNRGNSIIVEMFTRYFRVPEGFASFVYLSQVQQALAIKTGVEYWRSLRPRCMGTLYWQLDDCWPVCSWSSLEYGGKWKLLHYAARRFYAPLMVTAFRASPTGPVEIWAMNDRTKAVAGTLTLKVIGFDGSVRKTLKIPARLPAGSAVKLKTYEAAKLASSPREVFLHLGLAAKGETETAENDFYFAPWKSCTLPKAKVSMQISEGTGAGAWRVRLESDAPALFVTVDLDGVEGVLSDNMVTLLPGEPRELVLRTRDKCDLETVRGALKLYHLRDTYR